MLLLVTYLDLACRMIRDMARTVLKIAGNTHRRAFNMKSKFFFLPMSFDYSERAQMASENER